MNFHEIFVKILIFLLLLLLLGLGASKAQTVGAAIQGKENRETRENRLI